MRTEGQFVNIEARVYLAITALEPYDSSRVEARFYLAITALEPNPSL